MGCCTSKKCAAAVMPVHASAKGTDEASLDQDSKCAAVSSASLSAVDGGAMPTDEEENEEENEETDAKKEK